MPANVVKTERDERLWEKAKRLAKKQGKGSNWAYVNSVYQRMKKGAAMGRRKLYDVNPPIPIRDEFMSHPDFVVYDDVPGTKVAAFLEDATVEDRIALFRKADKLATSDLGEAYAELKRSGEDGAEEEDEEPDADDHAEDFVFAEGERMEEENA